MGERTKLLALLSRASLAASGRARFADGEAMLMAFLVGFTIVRLAALVVVVLVQFPGAEKSLFVAICISVVVALWVVTGGLATIDARHDADVRGFVTGTPRSRLVRRTWTLVHIFLRPMTGLAIAVLIGAVTLAMTSDAVSSRDALWAFGAVAVGAAAVALSSAVDRGPRGGAAAGRSGAIRIVSLLVIAAVVPDFRIVDGAVQPLLLVASSVHVAAFVRVALPLIPVFALPLVGLVTALLRRRVGPSRGTPRPIVSLLRTRFTIEYWIGLTGAAILASATVVRPLYLVLLASATGVLVLRTTALKIGQHFAGAWLITAKSRLFRNRIAGASAISAVLHALVAVAAILLVRG